MVEAMSLPRKKPGEVIYQEGEEYPTLGSLNSKDNFGV